MQPMLRTNTHLYVGTTTLLFWTASIAVAQNLMAPSSDGALRIMYTDQAILEAGEARKDLPCNVSTLKPVLGFDLRYHSGYEVSIPMDELSGSENLLTMIFRVTPIEPAGQAVYFAHKLRVPTIEEGAKGDAYLQGGFDTGEGKYKVEWLMRDRTERVCSLTWDVEAVLPQRDKQIGLSLPAGVVHPMDRQQFKEEPPIARAQEEAPLNVKVLINFAPQNARSATLQPLDTSALVSILRNISRDPRIGKFTVVAFNLQEQKVIYREENADRIDFPKLGEAIETLNLGTVDLERLAKPHGDTEFLTTLIRQEAGTAETGPDALVFAGPKALLDVNVPQDSLRQIGELNYPVFYMNYNLHPQSVPWNDTISKAVKFLKGYEYTISKPRDLWYAVTEMVSRIAKMKQGRRSGASASE